MVSIPANIYHRLWKISSIKFKGNVLKVKIECQLYTKFQILTIVTFSKKMQLKRTSKCTNSIAQSAKILGFLIFLEQNIVQQKQRIWRESTIHYSSKFSKVSRSTEKISLFTIFRDGFYSEFYFSLQAWSNKNQ